MRINNIFSFLRKHRVFLLIGTIFVGIFLLGLESAFAGGEEPVISKEDTEKVVKILNGFITGAAALMGMITSFITMFLYPGWVNGTLFGLQEYLKIMWILVSNIVYFIFAFILIAIAFMNIIGKGEGTWELKQAMPKFIIGVLIVPFSWFFVQFLLSLSAILTVGVLTLPYDSFGGTTSFEAALDDTNFAGQEICKDVIISLNGKFDDYDVQQLSSEANDLDENIKCKNDGKITIKELLTGTDENGDVSSGAGGLQNSIFGVMSIYAYGILHIDKLDEITGTQIEDIETIADLVFKIVFDVLFIAVYLLLMIALLLALFVRGVRLWIYMMLSPTFGLLYFFGSEGVGDGDNKFSIKEFIALALVPVYVSAALAFGLVFIMVASQGITAQNEDANTLEAGGFSLTILGAHGEGESESSVISKLIIKIFGIVILWIAVIAALNTSKTTGAIIKPIADFGTSVGKLAAAAPTYAPIIPTGGGPGSGMSITGLSSMGSKIEQSLRGEAQSRGSTFADKFIPNSNSTSSQMQDMVTRSGVTASSSEVERVEQIKRVLDAHGKDLSTDARARERLEDILKNLGVEVEISGLTDVSRLGTELHRGMKAAELPVTRNGIEWNNPAQMTKYLSDLSKAPVNPSVTPATGVAFAFADTDSDSGSLTDVGVTRLAEAIKASHATGTLDETAAKQNIANLIPRSVTLTSADDEIAKVLEELGDHIST